MSSPPPDTYEQRLKTFTNRPHKHPHPTAMAAAAGFIRDRPSSTYSDNASCFWCGKTLGGWEKHDDPPRQHLHHPPTCPFALKTSKSFTCRRCPERFTSDTKLHLHIDSKHAKDAFTSKGVTEPHLFAHAMPFHRTHSLCHLHGRLETSDDSFYTSDDTTSTHDSQYTSDDTTASGTITT